MLRPDGNLPSPEGNKYAFIYNKNNKNKAGFGEEDFFALEKLKLHMFYSFLKQQNAYQYRF